MEEILLFVRVILFFVFALAGIGKLLDADGSAKALRAFGMPEGVLPFLGYALPIAELSIAILLLFPGTSWYGAIAASFLLIAFIGSMVWQMYKGNAPDCHCFGQIHSAPVSITSILRNLILFAAAAFMAVRGQNFQGPSFAASRADVIQTLLLLLVVVAVIVAISYLKRLVDSLASIVKRVDFLEMLDAVDTPKVRDEAGDPHDGLPIGAVMPAFELRSRAGGIISRDSLLSAGRPLLFFFVGPNCSPCKALMPEIAEWHEEMSGAVDLILITTGTLAENDEKLTVPSEITVLFQEKRELAEALGAKWTPTAVLVRADGRIASHIAAGDTAVRHLITKVAAADKSDRLLYITNGNKGAVLPKIGKPVVDISLEDISGGRLTADTFKKKPTLAIAWSTTCSHCIQMMDSIKAWDRTKGEDDPNLVLFSSGDADFHKKLGLRSPIVLEEGYTSAAKIGLFGTPSGVLVDENGIIVSETAIGAEHIWSLIGKNFK